MLAENVPLREHSHLDLQPPDPLALEDRLCPGCKNSVVNEQGGLVVAFGYVASFLVTTLLILAQPILLSRRLLQVR